MKHLVRRAQRRDVEAFGALVERYQDAVYGTALALLGDVHDAQEVAQETFLQGWRDLKGLRDPDNFPAWICRIARNRSVDLVRRKDRAVSLEKVREPQSPELGVPALLEASERRETVMRAIQALSEPLRVTVTLFYINEYSEKDVSTFLGCPLGTVKRRLHEARRQLRKGLMHMVAEELKKSRPDQLKDRVLRRIRQMRMNGQYRAAAREGWNGFFDLGTGGDGEAFLRVAKLAQAPLASGHACFDLLPRPLIWREQAFRSNRVPSPAFHSNAFFHRHSFSSHGTLEVPRT